MDNRLKDHDWRKPHWWTVRPISMGCAIDGEYAVMKVKGGWLYDEMHDEPRPIVFIADEGHEMEWQLHSED